MTPRDIERKGLLIKVPHRFEMHMADNYAALPNSYSAKEFLGSASCIARPFLGCINDVHAVLYEKTKFVRPVKKSWKFVNFIINLIYNWIRLTAIYVYDYLLYPVMSAVMFVAKQTVYHLYHIYRGNWKKFMRLPKFSNWKDGFLNTLAWIFYVPLELFGHIVEIVSGLVLTLLSPLTVLVGLIINLFLQYHGSIPDPMPRAQAQQSVTCGVLNNMLEDVAGVVFNEVYELSTDVDATPVMTTKNADFFNWFISPDSSIGESVDKSKNAQLIELVKELRDIKSNYNENNSDETKDAMNRQMNNFFSFFKVSDPNNVKSINASITEKMRKSPLKEEVDLKRRMGSPSQA